MISIDFKIARSNIEINVLTLWLETLAQKLSC